MRSTALARYLLPGLWLSSSLLTEACQRRSTTANADCIDPAKVNPSGICTMEYAPVCGCDGKTYSNPCAARNAGLRTFRPGPCPGKP